METARNEGIPALPPFQPVAPVVHMPDEGDGQNRPSASDMSAIGASTTPTPPQRILVQADSAVLSITNAATSSSGDAVNGDDANVPPGNSAEEVRETPHLSLRGASRSPSAAFRGGRDVAVVTSMPILSSSSDTCVVVVDNGDDQR
jgi:hypothetical protein